MVELAHGRRAAEAVQDGGPVEPEQQSVTRLVPGDGHGGGVAGLGRPVLRHLPAGHPHVPQPRALLLVRSSGHQPVLGSVVGDGVEGVG